MSSNNTNDPLDAKVLLIEDSRDHQFLFIKRFNKIGIGNILVCETGEQGLEKFQSDPSFNLLIVDYSLPGKSGIDVIKEVRSSNSEIPIIMITGLGSEKVAVQAMKLGIQDYLTKDELLSISTSSLQEIITKILLEYRAHQEVALARRLAADPARLSVSVFKFSKMGPEPFLTSRLPFKLSIRDEETFLIKIGAHYMTVTGAGHAYSKGLFELPVPQYDKYHGLVFAFCLNEKNQIDDRFKGSAAKNYGLVVVIFPVLFRTILPRRSIIEKKMEELIHNYTDMEELDEDFISKVKNIFFED
ncbi:MAG: response regulator [Candidatus Hodarchaeales archaeon]|jgi:CheY-like chemotaxis protein